MMQGKRGDSFKKAIFQVGGTGYGISLQKKTPREVWRFEKAHIIGALKIEVGKNNTIQGELGSEMLIFLHLINPVYSSASQERTDGTI